MAKRTSLREFQEHLAERLAGAAEGSGLPAWLGVSAGGQRWLLDLSEAGEIIPLPQIFPVPLTKTSYAGLANIRGNLVSVTDFAGFYAQVAGREGEAVSRGSDARLLLIGAKHGSNAALLVGRMLGLRGRDSFKPVDSAGDLPVRPWIGEVLQDGEGQRWLRLNVRPLLEDPDFMRVGISRG